MAQAPLKLTDEQRRQVEAMAGYGVPQDDIALVIGISAPSLRKHCRTELRTGTAKANARMAQNLFQQGMDGNTVAAIFWLKARAGWSEKRPTEDGRIIVNITGGMKD